MHNRTCGAGGIHVHGVRYVPPGAAQPALNGVSLTIAPGEFVAVLGHNGSGKSTLARHLNGLLVPQTGRVVVDGLSVSDPTNLPRIRRRVGLIFQNPDHQIVGASVAEDVLWGMPPGLAPDDARRRMHAALQSVGMDAIGGQATWRLSGGQKQRLALAGVLARGPRYLVCDEPTALLDGQTREEVRLLLLGCRDRGLGLLWITHRLDEALLADRLLVLEAGQLVAAGSPHDVLAMRAELSGALPPLTGVARALRDAGIPVDELPDSPERLAESIARILDQNGPEQTAGDGRPGSRGGAA